MKIEKLNSRAKIAHSYDTSTKNTTIIVTIRHTLIDKEPPLVVDLYHLRNAINDFLEKGHRDGTAKLS